MAYDKRLIRIYKQGHGLVAGSQIFVDTLTRVQYFYHYDSYGGGLTVMLDPEGRPLLFQGSLEADL